MPNDGGVVEADLEFRARSHSEAIRDETKAHGFDLHLLLPGSRARHLALPGGHPSAPSRYPSQNQKNDKPPADLPSPKGCGLGRKPGMHFEVPFSAPQSSTASTQKASPSLDTCPSFLLVLIRYRWVFRDRDRVEDVGRWGAYSSFSRFHPVTPFWPSRSPLEPSQTAKAMGNCPPLLSCTSNNPFERSSLTKTTFHLPAT